MRTEENIHKIDLESKEIVWSKKNNGKSMTTVQGGDIVYTEQSDNHQMLIDVSCKDDPNENGCIEEVYTVNENMVRAMVSDGADTVYVGGSVLGPIHSFDVEEKSQNYIYTMHDGLGNVIDLSLDQGTLFSVSDEKVLHIIDTECLDNGGSDGQCRQREESFDGGLVKEVEASRGGPGTAYVGIDNSLKLLN